MLAEDQLAQVRERRGWAPQQTRARFPSAVSRVSPPSAGDSAAAFAPGASRGLRSPRAFPCAYGKSALNKR